MRTDPFDEPQSAARPGSGKHAQKSFIDIISHLGEGVERLDFVCVGLSGIDGR